MSDILTDLGMLIVVLGSLLIPALIIFYILRRIAKKYSIVEKSEKLQSITDQKIQSVFLKIEKVFPLPKPTEASLFVSSLTLILIACTYVEFWREIAYFGDGRNGGKWYLMILYAFLGAFYSIYHAFSKRNKTPGEEETLKYFSVITLIMASLSSGVYVFKSQEFGFIFFSALNFLHALKLIVLSGKKHLGDRIQISTRQAERKEIYLGIFVVLIIFGIEKYIYSTHWSILFSSVLFFWSLIGPFFHTEESKIEN